MTRRITRACPAILAAAIVAAAGLAAGALMLTACAGPATDNPAAGAPAPRGAWGKPARVAGDSGGLSAVSCATATDCLAIGAEGYAVTWNGARWSAPDLAIAGAAGIDALSCPSATFCAAAGDSLWTGHGTRWTRDGPVVDDRWRAVSCPSAAFCAAATGDGYVSEYNGRAWSAPVRIDSDVPESITVSCVSAARCVAMDGYGAVYDWDGSVWIPSRSFDKYTSLGCAPDGFCMAVDATSVYTSTGSSWSRAGTVEDNAALGHLSCESATFCMLLGAEGTADVYDGKGWTHFAGPVLPAPAGSDGYVPGALACSHQTCAAVLDAPAPFATVYRPA